MKKVKIFLASSITDLADDRLAVGDFFRQLNEIYVDLGVHFSLIKCEDYDNSIALSGKQSQYDEEIRDSELCFFLFFRKVGNYTLHEFDVAVESFRKTGKPRVVTYVKNLDSGESVPAEVLSFMQRLDGEMRHYYNTYGHIDTLKLGILMQIKLMSLDTSKDTELSVKDGEVRFMGESLFTTDNIPIFSGNEGLVGLTERKKRASQTLAAARANYLCSPSDENEASFFAASSEYNAVSKELSSLEEEMLSLVSAVAELTADGKVLTHRQKEALKLFNQGKYKEAQAVLDAEEREDELARAEARAEQAKNEFLGYVEENLLWIKAQSARGIDADSDAKIREKFERAIALIDKYNLDKEAYLYYIKYLYEQNEHKQAVDMAKRLLWYFERPGEEAKADVLCEIYNFIGLILEEGQEFDKAEEYYSKVFSICVGDGNVASSQMQAELAVNLLNRGKLCYSSKRYDKAEKYLTESEKLYIHLSKKYPKLYASKLALCYNNLGIVYLETRRFTEAEVALTKVRVLYDKMNELGIPFEQSDLLYLYNNLGLLYFTKNDYTKAEKIYLASEKKLNELSLKNPEAYKAKQALLFSNISNLYVTKGQYKDAEKYASMAVSAFEKLVIRSEAFIPNLALAYNNLGVLYKEVHKNAESLELFEKSAEMYTKTYKTDRKILLPILADITNNIASIYYQDSEIDMAFEKMKEAIGMYDELCVDEPYTYEPKRAFCYINISAVLSELERYEESLSYMKKAVETYERCAERDPSVYEANLAAAYSNLGRVYFELDDTELAIAEYKKAVEIEERLAASLKSGNPYSLAMTKNNLALVYEACELYEEEEECLVSAEEGFRPMYERMPVASGEDYINILRNLADFYIIIEDRERARMWAERILSVLYEMDSQNQGYYTDEIEEAKEFLDSI